MSDHGKFIEVQADVEGIKGVELPCGHKFDELCIAGWFTQKQNCPMCRKDC